MLNNILMLKKCFFDYSSQTRKKERNLFDKIVLWYVTVSVLSHCFLLIAPVLTFISPTPFYHIESILGGLGGILLLYDFFTERLCFKAKFSGWLYIMLFAAVISSLRTFPLGIKENIFSIAWMIICIALIYPASLRMNKGYLKKHLKISSLLMLVLWSIPCIISIYQFVNLIEYKYVVDIKSSDKAYALQGFVSNRLYGIFNPLNHAAIVSTLCFLISIFCILSYKGFKKIIFVFFSIIFYLHILLSGSRGAMLSLYLCLIVGMFMYYHKSSSTKYTFFYILKNLALVVFLIALFTGFNAMMKLGLEQLPRSQDAYLKNRYEEINLERSDDLREDVSNNRLKIWKDYSSLTKEIGLFGLSPGNSSMYIIKNHPNLYIVQYVKDKFPAKFNNGLIYHTHNGYIETFVSTGFIGIISVFIFLLLSFKNLVSNIMYRKLSEVGRYFSLIVLVCLFSAVYERELFFINNPITLLFWYISGFLNHNIILKTDLKNVTES